MNKLIERYNKYKKEGSATMMSYCKNRLIRFHNYYIEDEE